MSTINRLSCPPPAAAFAPNTATSTPSSSIDSSEQLL